MFELLKKEVQKYFDKKVEKLYNEKKSDIIAWYGTNLTKVKYKNGELEEEKAYNRALKRALKDIESDKEKRLAKIEMVENAETLEYIRINVDWKKSRTWGANPHVETWTNNRGYYTATAGGCGYDKESSAVAETLNQSPEVLKVLYTLAENVLKELGDVAYYYTGCGGCVSWRNSIGYGSGYDILPYFEGGVGISCFESILNKCGYKWQIMGSGKTWDCYYISKRED